MENCNDFLVILQYFIINAKTIINQQTYINSLIHFVNSCTTEELTNTMPKIKGENQIINLKIKLTLFYDNFR